MPACSLLSAPTLLAGTSSTLNRTLSYHSNKFESKASVHILAPLYFPRRITRPVSCYAFFKGWLLLSQPPGMPGMAGGAVVPPVGGEFAAGAPAGAGFDPTATDDLPF